MSVLAKVFLCCRSSLAAALLDTGQESPPYGSSIGLVLCTRFVYLLASSELAVGTCSDLCRL